MSIARRVLLLAACLAAGACSDGPTESDAGSLPLGETAVATTAANGQATVSFQGGDEREYQIPVTLQDFDTERGVAGLQVHAVALADGIFLRTEDPSGRYVPSTQYVPYSQFQNTSNVSTSVAISDDGRTVEPSPIAIVAVLRLAIAVFSAGSALYEYATDPPGIEEVFNEDGTTSVCITGDLNDALGAWSARGVRTVSGAIRIFGAPARLRGVTSINLGFTWLSVYQQFNREALQVLVDEYSGLLDSDVKVWCWREVQGEVIPILRGDVTRRQTQFDISRVLSRAVYPVAPSRSQITTDVGAEWSGNPVFPVDLIVTPVSCYPGWVCFEWTGRFQAHANPLRITFGCWASSPAARSGSMTFRMQLRDRNGVTTPPATFNFRCGGNGDRADDAVPQPLGADAPGGFAGPMAAGPPFSGSGRGE